MFIFGLFQKGGAKKNVAKRDNLRRMELGDGYYLEYSFAGNGYGGFHPVNIVLKNSNDKKCRHVITDGSGNFVCFPGVKKGAWEKELERKFRARVDYTFSVSKLADGVCYVIWLVQPDGRYFEDEDGFGAENCSEVKLYSMMNTKGRFICPFTDERMKGCGGCYTL